MSNLLHSVNWTASSFSWTATEDCWVFGGVSTNKKSTAARIKLNNKDVIILYTENTTYTSEIDLLFPCKKGDVISKDSNGTNGQMYAYGMRK